jgi:methylation protein EvaC
MSACRLCQSSIEPFIDFGRMPLANGFLTADQFGSEYFFNLSAACCRRCSLVQLIEQPPRERMFNERYPFFTATSSHMTAHFSALAREVITAVPPGNPFVVEIGSNDGTLLRHLAQAGIRHAGIEPSRGVGEAARSRGVNSLCRFFDTALARELVAEYGTADAIIAANALSHVADLHAVVAGIKILLAPHGTCIIEDPYWGDVVAQTAFDQIYDEHASYFSVSSMTSLMACHGLAVVDVSRVPVHGGSVRYLIAAAGSRTPSPQVAAFLDREQAEGLHDPGTHAAFRDRITRTGRTLMALLGDYRAQGKRVVGYGATSKSTTSINFFGITPELVEFISDTTPAKHGTFTPGAHIPVRPHEAFTSNYPDRALLFSWNHAAEIRAKESAFARQGGRWIVYVPGVEEW